MTKVVIGMPVYNEEWSIGASITSVLFQTYRDFTLIISDNCSTDDTEKICKSFKDKRIRYYRTEKNLGSVENFNLVLNLVSESPKYFVWVSGHDLWDEKFLERAVRVMDRDKGVAVCNYLTNKTDFVGFVQTIKEKGLHSVSTSSHERVKDTITQLNECPTASNAIYGLIRYDTLKWVRPVQPTFASDHLTLIELSFHGKIHEIKEPYYYQRMKENKVRDNNTKKAFHILSPNKNHILYLTYTRAYLNYLWLIDQLPMTLTDKLDLWLHSTWVIVRTKWRRILVMDFLRQFVGENTIYKWRGLR